MSSKDGEDITDRLKRYLKRRQKKFDYTNDDQDKGKAHKSGSDVEGKDFAKILLKAMQDLAREIKDMRLDKIKKSPKRFHLVENSSMSHHWNDQPVHQPQVSQCSTMPNFLAMGNEGILEQASLEDYFEEYESQN